MLKFEHNQKAAFDRDVRKDFCDRLAAELFANHPESYESPDDPALRDLIDSTIAVAKAHGIASKHAIAEFASLRVAYGLDFELTPAGAAARDVLKDPTLPGPIKVSAMAESLHETSGGRKVTAVAWDEAADS